MFYISAALTVGWFFFMTYLSHQNGEGTSRTSKGLADQLERYFPIGEYWKLHGILRQSAHVIVFAVFAVLLLFTISQRWDNWRNYTGAIVSMLLWTWIDEATKPWIQGRHFSWYDVRLNLLGVWIGTIIFIVYMVTK